jgi:hypothetical protein
MRHDILLHDATQNKFRILTTDDMIYLSSSHTPMTLRRTSHINAGLSSNHYHFSKLWESEKKR